MGNGDSTAQPPQGHGHDPNKPSHNNNVNINNVDQPNQTEIDLSDKNITELTKDLAKYSNLEVVKLNNNKLTSLVGIISISKIRELSISNNLLKQIDEELFFLKQLQKLDVSNNFITTMDDLFGNLFNLRELNLSNNNIKSICPTVQLLQQLTMLNLSYNLIDEIPTTISQLAGLQHLLLHQNNLKTIASEIGMLEHLVVLNLSNNEIVEMPDTISRLTALSKLYLDNNEMFELPLSIGNCCSLKELGLNSNQLMTLPPSITKLTRLAVLDLADNLFEDKNIYSQPDPASLFKYITNRPPKEGKRTWQPKKPRTRHFRLPSTEVTVAPRRAVLGSWGDDENNQNNTNAPEVPSAKTVPTLNVPKPNDNGKKSGQTTPGSATTSPDTSNEFVVSANKRRLYRFKCVQNIVLVDKLPCVMANLADDDVFLLDNFNSMFVWVGYNSDKREKEKAIYFAQKITTEEAFGANIIILEGKQRYSRSLSTDFWKAFGVANPKKISYIKNATETDNQYLMKRLTQTKLYRFSEDENDRLNIVVLQGEPLSKTMLDSVSCFVLDSISDVYVWIGLYATMNCKSWAALKAEELAAHGTDRNVNWTIDGAETWEFMEQFYDWMDDSWDTAKAKFYTRERSGSRSNLNEEPSPKPTDVPETITEEPETQPATPGTAAEDSGDEFDSMSTGDDVSIADSDVSSVMSESPRSEMSEVSQVSELSDVSSEEEPAAPPPKVSSPRKEFPSMPEIKSLPPVDLKTRLKPFEDAMENQEQILRRKRRHKMKDLPLEYRLSAFISKPNQAPGSPRGRPPTETISEEPEEGAADIAGSLGTTKTSTRLANPRRIAAPGRAPTRNPMRTRNDTSSQSMSDKTEEAQGTDQPKRTNAAAAQVGGYGLLYSIGADQVLFQRKNLKSTGPVLSEKGQPRLIHIKGRKRIFVRQVEMARDSLNEGDVFILDNGKDILFQWNGRKSNRIEKGKALDMLKNIKGKEKGGNARYVMMDQGTSDTGSQAEEFWRLIGTRGEILTEEQGGDDLEVEKMITQFIQLFKVVQVKNKIEPVLVASGVIKKEILEEDSCFVLDCISELFVWCGRKSAVQLRNHTLKLAQELKSSREVWTAPISRELPDAETVLFREKFANWGFGATIQIQQVASGKNVAGKKTSTISESERIRIIADKLSKDFPLKEEVMIDNGEGKLQIWRVEEFTKVEVSKSHYGQFYSADSYLILYSYMWRNKESYLIYFWQGRDSPSLDRGTSALLTMEMDNELKKAATGGSAKEIRVVQNQEPKHFLAAFNGKLLIHRGRETAEQKETKLFEVSGSAPGYVRAVEVDCSARALTSASCFVLLNSKHFFIWRGKMSHDYEFEYAQHLAKHMKLDAHVIEEGGKSSKHADKFWKLLETSASDVKIMSMGYPQGYQRRQIPRLFRCSIASGDFQVDEVWPFCQDDLERNDCFVLDTYHRIYVWQHETSHDFTELKLSMEFAVAYFEKIKANDKRPGDASETVLHLKGGKGKEPRCFTQHFVAWSPVPSHDEDGLGSVPEYLAQYNRKYTYQELVERQFPAGIDVANLENYLEDDEFEEVLGMNREEFAKVPEWKKQKIKRQKQLY